MLSATQAQDTMERSGASRIAQLEAALEDGRESVFEAERLRQGAQQSLLSVSASSSSCRRLIRLDAFLMPICRMHSSYTNMPDGLPIQICRMDHP